MTFLLKLFLFSFILDKQIQKKGKKKKKKILIQMHTTTPLKSHDNF